MKSFIDIRELDILKYFEENKDKKLILFHQTNCFNTLGRARWLAGVLDKKFIEIVQADQKTIKGDKEKLKKERTQLKTFTQCLVESEEGPKGRAKDPIKMNTLNGYGDKSPIKKKMQAKKVLIICVVSFLFIAF